MPFGYLKRMFFKTRPKKALLTRTSTLPEINLASPIYIVIENAEDDPIQNTIDESNDDLIIPGINRQGGLDSMTINADVSPLVTPPPPIVIDDDDVEEPSGTPVEDNDFPRGILHQRVGVILSLVICTRVDFMTKIGQTRVDIMTKIGRADFVRPKFL